MGTVFGENNFGCFSFLLYFLALLIECLPVIKLSIHVVCISFFIFYFWEDNCVT